MCGISGYIDMKHGVDKNVLRDMTQMIRHRGPDDEGYALFTQNKVVFAKGDDTAEQIDASPIEDIQCQDYFMGFGHRRLSILDLSVLGHQPMQKHNKVLTYNGEVYNYIEIREELKKQGYTFVSNCDSEVILSAYDCWGDRCVEKFNGMWAFAIYDLSNHNLFMSRDRFGVKPLYYYYNNDKLIFSSEIKQILRDETVTRIVNEEILAHYLKYNFREYSENTFFKGISVLIGGCNMNVTFDFNKKCIKDIKIDRYYALSERVKVQPCDDSAKLIGDALRKAVRLRMRSDVKVGSCLSGGLDSSSIVGIVCDSLKKDGKDSGDFETVTIGFPGEDKINEVNFSKAVVDYCGCKENLITPDSKSMMEHLEKLVWHDDEPLPHLGIEVSYAVFKGAADNGCEVFFDGQGGDEGLTGYYFYYANYLWNVLKKQGGFKFRKELKKIVSSSDMSYKAAIIYMLYFNIPAVRMLGNEFRRGGYMSKRARKAVNTKNLSMFFGSKDGLDRQIEDYLYGSLPCILHWEDRNSMASSVETRLPFLDYEYVEKVLSVAVTDKLEKGYTKAPLRKYMVGMLPDDVIWRKNKLGFPAPTEKWLWEMPKEYIMELLDNAKSGAFFNIRKLKSDYLRHKGDASMLQKFIAVELWMRAFELRSEA